MKTNSHDLAEEILLFLAKHGQKNQWEGEDGDWTSTDAAFLENIAIKLKNDESVVQGSSKSSWQSGGYAPYADKAGELWHDSIIAKLKANQYLV